MDYLDVDNFYPAVYHVGVLLQDKDIATHDASSIDSFGGWLITLDTFAEENQHKNIALYEIANRPEYSQNEATWPRENVTIQIMVRASGYLSAYTRAQQLCRALDNGYRSFFNMWDGQIGFYSGWQVKYEYGGLYRQMGPHGTERDDKWRPRFQIEYTCSRRVREVASIT